MAVGDRARPPEGDRPRIGATGQHATGDGGASGGARGPADGGTGEDELRMTRRRVSITTKLAAALAVPLAALSLVAGLEVGQSVRDARDVARQTDLATASIGPSGLITALQNERNFTGLWLLGSEKAVQLPVTSMEQARSETDAARQAFTDELARKGGAAARIYGPAMDKLSRLTKMRAAVDAYDGPKAVSLFNETANNSFTDY